MKPNLLFYRQLLCGALGGLDNYEERAMVRRLILRIDAKEVREAVTEQGEYWRAQYTTIMRIALLAIAAILAAIIMREVL